MGVGDGADDGQPEPVPVGMPAFQYGDSFGLRSTSRPARRTTRRLGSRVMSPLSSVGGTAVVDRRASARIRATTDLSSLPISPWAGLGVLAAWSAAALVIGGLLLQLRDA
jgi:hypothetical protein